jgi:DNA-binding NtrC family response regulator
MARVCLVASTFVPLFNYMQEGRFNRHLFYYLNVIPFELPLIDGKAITL